MPNRLAHETSPYLLQHADNPVDWYPWGEEAFAKAREEDKPILLSIGYSACHWCHVMERESFENAETAKLMNEHFVQRQGRPRGAARRRLDLHGRGRRRSPAAAAGRSPSSSRPTASRSSAARTSRPTPRHGHARRSASCLQTIDGVWRDKREEVDKSSQALMEHLRGRRAEAAGGRGRALRGDPLRRAREPDGDVRLRVGRLGQAPKFPPAPTLEFLLRRGATRPRRDDARQDGARRHVRRRRRRLPPLLGRPASGSCRTSRRCSTTTRCSPSATSTAGRCSARSATARSPSRPSSTCCASSRSRAAGSRRRRTPTPTATRA